MELRVLKYFLTVAREENITRAAALLHLTQPTLSRQLMNLEEELGVKLFNRSRYRIILTEEGMLLRRRAQEIVALSDKTEQELSREKNELTGEIAIGCGETQSMTFLSRQICAFRAQYPLVRFRIYSANADDIKERMEKGLLDLGLLMEPVDMGRYEFVRMQEKTNGACWLAKILRWQKKMPLPPRTWRSSPCCCQAGRVCVANWPAGSGISIPGWKWQPLTISC